jgi:hypothetical protein
MNPEVEACSKHYKDGRQCTLPRMVGLEVCYRHGGASKRARVKSRLAKSVKSERDRLGLGGKLEINPIDAMLAMVHEAASNVAALRAVVSLYDVAVGFDGCIALPERDIEWDKGGAHVDAQVHILVALYNHERDRLVKYSKDCVSAGVDERRVRIAETQSMQLADALGRALDQCAHLMSGAAKDEFKRTLAHELRKLGAGAGQEITA